MKVLMNGATLGTNFGDYLLARIFQDRVGRIVGSEKVMWYQSKYAYSAYFERWLDNHLKYSLKDIDLLVYISGGYFCSKDQSIHGTLKRFMSYYLIGFWCILRKIPYIIIGVDVAWQKEKVSQYIQKVILSHAAVISVRNEESLECLKRMGITGAECTHDTVFAMPKELYHDEQLPDELSKIAGKKLLFHVNAGDAQNAHIKSKVVPVIDAFLAAHPEYSVIITTDQYSTSALAAEESIKAMLHSEKVYVYKYDNPLNLCKLIESVDTVVTTKLHVGIVSLKMGKAVISFSGHTEKIERLYKQIGIGEQSISIKEMTVEMGCEMMERFYNRTQSLPQEFLDKAQRNLQLLDESVYRFMK